MTKFEDLASRSNPAVTDLETADLGLANQEFADLGLGDLQLAAPKPTTTTKPPSVPLRQGGPRLLFKRSIDIAVSVSALVLTAPLLALVALAIKLDSRGPVLYTSTRIGQGADPIRLLKFRSMAHEAPLTRHQNFLERSRSGEVQQSHHKVEDDPRVTRVGQIIRKLSIDELPQLINVLKGEMSLVGPRPDLPYALKLYRADDWDRFTVLPGITGLWQVSGRSALSVIEMYDLDTRYARQWSTRLDLRILLLTVPAMFRVRHSG